MEDADDDVVNGWWFGNKEFERPWGDEVNFFFIKRFIGRSFDRKNKSLL